MSNVLLSIDFLQNGNLTMRSKNPQTGSIGTKEVDFEAFRTLLQKMESCFETDFLSPNFLKVISNSKFIGAVMYFPAVTIPYKYQAGGETTNGLMFVPQMVWSLELQITGMTKSIRHLDIYCLDNLSKPTLNAQLYTNPFNNYSPTFGGGVCWGSNGNVATDVINKPMCNWSSLYNIYFGSTFNDHLGGHFYDGEMRRAMSEAEIKRNNNVMIVYDYMQAVASGGVNFNPSVLKKSNKTIEGIINEMKVRISNGK